MVNMRSLTRLIPRLEPDGHDDDRRTGNAFRLLAVLVTAAGIGLSMSLRFPEVLLDPASFGVSLASARPVLAVASLLLLAASGAVLLRLSRVLLAARPPGRAAGCGLIAGAAAGLVLLVLWGGEFGTAATVVARIGFAVHGLAVPLLLAAWTVRVARTVGGALAGWLAAAGLLVTAARSAVWWLNAALPVEAGFHFLSAILTLAALIGAATWICWLVATGARLRASRPVPARRRLGTSTVTAGRAGFSAAALAVAARRGGFCVVTVAFVSAYAAVVIGSTPVPRTPDVAAVPSAAAALFQPVMLAAADAFAQPTTYEELVEQRKAERFTNPKTPPGATIDKVDAGGVPAEYLCADGSTKERVFLYLHGGGFIMPMSNSHRDFAAELSRRTGSCLLLPHYRLAPEHPFPAPVEDAVAAYRWLLDSKVAASAVTVIGDSCGGTFTLATALSLQNSGEAPPAALVALSPATDLTFTGDTHRSNAWTDPLIAGEHKKFVQRSYTGDGAADVRDPLLSPLFADTGDLAKLPPTLIQAGSEETLLSDSTRFADRMRMASGEVELELWPGLPHTVPLLFPETMEAQVSFDHIADFTAAHVS